MDPVHSLRDEPTVAELIAARERTDATNRKAMPALFRDSTEVLRIEDAPVTKVRTLTHVDAGAIASDLLSARDHLHAAAMKVPLEGNGNRKLHRRINDALNEIDEAGVELAKEWPA